jgi:hypothetical protein
LPHGAKAIPPARGSKGEAPTAPAYEAFTPDLLNFAISPASGDSGDFDDISLCCRRMRAKTRAPLTPP